MSLTPDDRWQTPFCVNIFMLIVTTNAALSNRLISSALSDVLFERPKKPVPAHNTGCFTVQNSPFQVTGWYMPKTGRWITFFSRIFASMSGKRIFIHIFLSAVSRFSVPQPPSVPILTIEKEKNPVCYLREIFLRIIAQQSHVVSLTAEETA